DSVEDACLLDRAQAAFVAAHVPHATLLANVAEVRSCVWSATYETLTVSAPSSCSTSHDSTAIRCPSSCWSEPCTMCWVVATSSGPPGSKTRLSRPLP